ncbi:DeoR family transcriptional regulator, partial [Enterococcus faecalis]|uniref:DeoR family transcriptional regulator n=1 Tax=Enterococcus faecalis TaxID=1351 RepID=UPI003CC5798B
MKSSLETIEKRQQNILALLQKNKQMTTYKLAEVLNVSLSTIRRDLNVLETKNDII